MMPGMVVAIPFADVPPVEGDVLLPPNGMHNGAVTDSR
jgi:hypothetical protein